MVPAPCRSGDFGPAPAIVMLSAYGLMPLSMAGAGLAVYRSVQGMFVIAGAAVGVVSILGDTERCPGD